MPGIRRFRPKTYGVICDTCDFPTEGTMIGAHRAEARIGRAQQCIHKNSEDGFFLNDCPHWERSMKAGRLLDDDGNLAEGPAT